MSFPIDAWCREASAAPLIRAHAQRSTKAFQAQELKECSSKSFRNLVECRKAWRSTTPINVLTSINQSGLFCCCFFFTVCASTLKSTKRRTRWSTPRTRRATLGPRRANASSCRERETSFNAAIDRYCRRVWLMLCGLQFASRRSFMPFPPQVI